MYTATVYHHNIYPTGRTFFVGDIHGCLDTLNTTLAAVNFSPENGDILVSVGDLIDRGVQSTEVLQLLSEDWFYAVLGNHEKMLFDALVRRNAGQLFKWMANGGQWYFRLNKRRRSIVRDIARKHITHLPYAITVNLPSGEKIGVVHGEVPDKTWLGFLQGLINKRYQHRVLWGRVRARQTILAMKNGARQALEPIEGVGAVVFGHTPMRKGPVVSQNIMWIDTGAVYGSRLTLIESSQIMKLTGSQPLAYQLRYER